ncbi:type II toxin-antitoxin system VapC family toxin [Acidothermaceae bacterium B102]|nr:type II toxin-antitoxin system VapC family toxin [Acidothermaceae bacterium B102]
MFVIDTSVAMAWCFEDEASKATDAVLDRLRDDQAVVPTIWPLEIANVLLVAERRGRISEAQASRFLTLLSQLPIDLDDSATDLSIVIAAGRRHTLSSYDASYLLLAERLGSPLATLDQPLAQAARKAGVRLLIKPPVK